MPARIEEIMTREVATVSPGASLSEAARLMWEKDCGFIPVVEGKNRVLRGVITDRDICMAGLMRGVALQEIKVEDCMSHEVRSCGIADEVPAAEALMRQNRIRRIPVVNEQREVAGVLSINDLAIEAGRGGNKKKVTAGELARTLAAICAHGVAEPPKEQEAEG